MSRPCSDLNASDGYAGPAARPMAPHARPSALGRPSAWQAQNEPLPRAVAPGSEALVPDASHPARRALARAVWLGLALLLAGVALLYHRATSQAFYAAGVLSWIAAALLFRASRARALRELSSEHERRGLSSTAAHERAVAMQHALLVPEPRRDAVAAQTSQAHHERFPLA